MLPGTSNITPGMCIIDAGFFEMSENTLPAIDTASTAAKELNGESNHNPAYFEDIIAIVAVKSIHIKSTGFALKITVNAKLIVIIDK